MVSLLLAGGVTVALGAEEGRLQYSGSMADVNLPRVSEAQLMEEFGRTLEGGSSPAAEGSLSRPSAGEAGASAQVYGRAVLGSRDGWLSELTEASENEDAFSAAVDAWGQRTAGSWTAGFFESSDSAPPRASARSSSSRLEFSTESGPGWGTAGSLDPVFGGPLQETSAPGIGSFSGTVAPRMAPSLVTPQDPARLTALDELREQMSVRAIVERGVTIPSVLPGDLGEDLTRQEINPVFPRSVDSFGTPRPSSMEPVGSELFGGPLNDTTSRIRDLSNTDSRWGNRNAEALLPGFSGGFVSPAARPPSQAGGLAEWPTRRF